MQCALTLNTAKWTAGSIPQPEDRQNLRFQIPIGKKTIPQTSEA